MKKPVIISAAVMLICVICLSGCSKYISKYNAVGFVHSNDYSSAFMNFQSFEGTIVYTLNPGNDSEGELKYSGKLETGNATVYYDCDGTKKELFSISSDGEVDSSIPDPGNKTVYVIVETDGKCENGDFKFELD